MIRRAVTALVALVLACAALPIALIAATAAPAGAATVMISSSVSHPANCSGSDVTTEVRDFLGTNATTEGNTYQLQPNSCYIVNKTIGIHRGVTIDLNGSTIKRTQVQPVKGGPGDVSVFKPLANADNVTIRNGTVLVRDGLPLAKYDATHPFEHGVAVLNSGGDAAHNLTVEDMTFDGTHGDCFWAQGGLNYLIEDIECKNVGRQGMAPVAGSQMVFNRIHFDNIARTCFDFESNGPGKDKPSTPQIEPQSHAFDTRYITLKYSTFTGCSNGAVNSEGYNPWIDHIWFDHNIVGGSAGFKADRDNCSTADAGRRNQYYITNNTFLSSSNVAIVLCGVDNAEKSGDGCDEGDYGIECGTSIAKANGGSIIANNVINSTVQLTNAGNWGRIAIQNNTYVNATAPFGGSPGTAPFLCRNTFKGGPETPSSCSPRAVPPPFSLGSGPTTPSAPQNVSASAGNGSATVSFSAPNSNGGAPITGYRVTSTPGNVTKSGSGSPITVTGLNNGTIYTFKVQAINKEGAGALSSASNAVTPTGSETVPGAPTIGTATAGDKSASVTWSAPSSDGGAAINAYIVYSDTSTANPVAYKGPETPLRLTVSNLVNGRTYQFTVRAQNSIGLGGPSALSNVVVPTAAVSPTVPDPPTIGTATAGDTNATVRWTPPVDDGGSVLTGFKVTSSPATTTKTVSGAGATSTVFTGLTNGVAYTFTVKATNAQGDSSSSSASNSVTPTAGDAPEVAPCDLMIFTDASGLRDAQVDRAQSEMTRACRAVRGLITGSYTSSTPVCDNITVDTEGNLGLDAEAAAQLEQGLRAACQGMRGLAPVSGSTTTEPSTAQHGACDAIEFASQTGMDTNRRKRAQEAFRNACDAFRRVVTDDYDDVTQGPACDNITVDAPESSTPPISAFAAAVSQVGWRGACTGAGALDPENPTRVCDAIVFDVVSGLDADEVGVAEDAMRTACEAARNVSVTNYNSTTLGPVCSNIHVVKQEEMSALHAARLQRALRDACNAARDLVDNASLLAAEECDSIELSLPDGATQEDYDAALAAAQQACEDALGGGS